MKAIIWPRYGAPEVMQLQEVDQPVPKDQEILVKIHAATVTAGDCEMRRFDLPGWIWLFARLYMGIRQPRHKRLGQEFSGVIAAVGKKVTQYTSGDAIFADTGMHLGAYAEYLCLAASHAIAPKPSNMTFEEAATIPTGGMNALHFLRMAKVQPGEKVLINGAGGSIGTYGVQIARLWGAEVTVVDTAAKLEMLRDLGADHAIDYTKEDFTQNGQSYDVIIDVVGACSFSRCIQALKSKGRLVLGNPRLGGMMRGVWTSVTSDKKVLFALAEGTTKDYNLLREWIEAGHLKSVIDRSYALDQIVEAHHYVEAGHKAGNVVIKISE